MEDEGTNTTSVLQYLKQISLQLSELKKDVEGLKKDQMRREKFGQHTCDGNVGEDKPSRRDTFQNRLSNRLYSFQGRDDLD